MLKRTLLCLALALILCFGLCACDSELPPEQLDILQGTWLNEDAIVGGKPIGDIPYLIELSADGTCAFNGEGGMTWNAKRDKKTEYLEVKIYQDKEVVYRFIVKPLGRNGINGYQAFLTNKFGAKLRFGSFTRPGSAEPYADWIGKVSAEWYPRGDGIASLPLTIHADGTCTVDSKSYRWAISPYNGNVDNTSFDAFIYDNQQILYRFCAYFNTSSKTAQLVLNNNRRSWVSDYDFHPLTFTLINRNWKAFDQDNTVAAEVLPAYDNIHFWIPPGNSKHLTWEISDSTTDEKIIICVPDAAAPQYIVSMYMNGEYPQMELEVKETGEILFYYQYDKGYDPANPEAPNQDA